MCIRRLLGHALTMSFVRVRSLTYYAALPHGDGIVPSPRDVHTYDTVDTHTVSVICADRQSAPPLCAHAQERYKEGVE